MNWVCGCGRSFDDGGALLGHVRDGCDQTRREDRAAQVAPSRVPREGS